MNLHQAESLAWELLNKYNLTLKGWTFKFTSSKRFFGFCHHWNRRITLSKYLTVVNNEYNVRDTILHEIAHAIAGEDHGHDNHWRQICTQIGARPERCYGREVTRVHRLIAACPTCTKTFRRNRQPRVGRFSYCSACGMKKGKLVWLVNPEFENIFNLTKKSIDNVFGSGVRLDHKVRQENETGNKPDSENEIVVSVKNLEVNQLTQIEKEHLQKMSLMLIKKSSLPVSPRGKAGTLAVRVADNGQIGFSTSAGEIIKGFTNAVIGWDAEDRKMTITAVDVKKLPKGVTESDTFLVGQSKDGARYISAAGLFKHDSVAYDYKASGSHSFDATVDEAKHSVTFTLPEKMEPKPKQERKPRKAKTAAAGTANTANDEETVLQEA